MLRLYEQMWSVERIARLFGSRQDVMRRLIGRHMGLRKADRPRNRWWRLPLFRTDSGGQR